MLDKPCSYDGPGMDYGVGTRSESNAAVSNEDETDHEHLTLPLIPPPLLTTADP